MPKTTDFNDWIDTHNANPDIPEGELYEAWRLRKKTLEEFSQLSPGAKHLSYDQLAYLSWFGLLAPTSHNTVPERLKLNEEKQTIELWLDRSKILPFSDKTGRQAAISMGAVVTNLEIAAACYGLASSSTFCVPQSFALYTNKSKSRYIHVLTVSFSPSNHPNLNHSWLQAIIKRKVVRGKYDTAIKLPAALIAAILKLVKTEYPEINLHILVSPEDLFAVGKYQEEADKFVFEDREFAKELGEWLLPNSDQKTVNGMRGVEFGFDNAYARHIHDGLVQKEPLLPDEIAGFAIAAKFSMIGSSAIGIISVTDDTVKKQIHAGRAYEKIALYLQQHNFSTSIYAGISEVDFVNQSFATTVLHSSKRPTMIFRIGKPKRPQDAHRPHSARPRLTDILLTDRSVTKI